MPNTQTEHSPDITTSERNGSAIEVVDAILDSSHFTTSGKQQFEATVEDYTNQLLSKSVHFGEIDRASGLAPEITHDHVRSAAAVISSTFGRAVPPKWLIPANVGEHLSTAAAGVGGGHLDKPWGIATFGIGISIAVILVVVRLTIGKGS